MTKLIVAYRIFEHFLEQISGQDRTIHSIFKHARKLVVIFTFRL
jgi:hypothetical protein